MLSGLRTIFFETSLRWLPLEGYGIKKDAIRRLYNKMFEPGGYRYENLDLQADSPVLSTKHSGGGLSACRFGASSVTIEEKKSLTTVESFIEAVRTVLGGMKEEDVPLGFFLQQCRMQCLAQPSNVEHSLELLAAKVANVYHHVDPFGRPPSFFGVRFRFAPVILIEGVQELESAGEEEANSIEPASDQSTSSDAPQEAACDGSSVVKKGFVDIRFETHTEDISQVWMEVTASYPEAEPLSLRDERITENIRETHIFLAEQGKRFLDQFDDTNQ